MKKHKIQPRHIRLEASTLCQLKCRSCPNANGLITAPASVTKPEGGRSARSSYQNTRAAYLNLGEKGNVKALGLGYLKFEDFTRLVEANPWARLIELSNWGEIFLNPDLLKIMEFAHKKAVALTAENGVNLNTVKEPVLEGLVKFKFRNMTCSIDGASSETYAKYRVGGSLKDVIGNIKKINEFKKRYRSNFPLLVWQFIPFDYNVREIEAARNMAKGLKMKFLIKFNFDNLWAPIGAGNEDLVRDQTIGRIASREEYFQRYGTMPRQKMICAQFWTSPQINWDGRLLGCCVNYWGDFGNVFKEGLPEVINNEKMDYARRMLLGKAEAREDVVCYNCIYYYLMKDKEKWLTMADIRLYESVASFKDRWISLFKFMPLPGGYWA